MMSDRTTKILLALIALGLWANVLGPVLKPLPAFASDSLLRSIDSTLEDIARGNCSNSKIC